MNPIKINNAENYESINVTLSRENTPIAFQNKLDELMECKCFDTVEEAEKFVSENPIELELYYEKNQGLFAVESESIEIPEFTHSPYSGVPFYDPDEGKPDDGITDYAAERITAKLNTYFIDQIINKACDQSTSQQAKREEIKNYIMKEIIGYLP